MQTNLLYRLKSNARAGKKCIEPKPQLTIPLLAAVALAFGVALAAQPAYAADVGGRWYHDGKPTSISVSGINVTITNEQGRSSSGHITGNDLVIASLGIRGHVTHGGQRISWSNGTEWTRESRKGGREFGQGPDLNGRWYHDGKPTSISVSSGGRVSITNEQGQSSHGSMSGNDITISGGLRGNVSHNGRRISWSNGTEWRR